MSYCRFSSDDFQSDVYCYAHVYGGYQIHVACQRIIPAVPLPPKLTNEEENDGEKWLARHNKVMEIITISKREPIGLLHDGYSCNVETAQDCLDFLLMLRKEGYNVPQEAIDRLNYEISEGMTDNPGATDAY